MFRILPIVFLSLPGSMAAPECTAALCCHPYKYDYCKDNMHKTPVGSANPVAYTASELASNLGDVLCTTGYKDKNNKAGIIGNAVATCCDQKTCSDLTCPTGEKPKTSPTQPTAGNEPAASDCCEDKTGMCSGNKVSSTDVTCGTGYNNKANKASITGNDVAACCDQKTCSDLTCPSDKQVKTSPTQPTAGNNPTVTDCCESHLNTCMSYQQNNVAYVCGAGIYAMELATVLPVTAVAAVDCANDAFDIAAVQGVVGYGPVCPEAGSNNVGTASPATRSTNKLAWYCISASGLVMLAWHYFMF